MLAEPTELIPIADRAMCDCCGARPWTHHYVAGQTNAQCETCVCCECANCDGDCE